MSALPLPNARTQFIDADGAPLVGGQVFTYVPATTDPKTTWQDAGQTILNDNPIILDDLGSAIIYGDGSYRQLVLDVLGNLVWDVVTNNGLSGFASINLSNVDHSVLYGPGVTSITTNTDLSGAPIEMLNGATFNITGGTLTLPAAFKAPSTRIFTGNITDIYWLNAPTDGVDPKWFGLVTSTSIPSGAIQSANVTAWNAAEESFGFGFVRGWNGQAWFNGTLNCMSGSGKGVKGVASGSTILNFTHDGAMFSGGSGSGSGYYDQTYIQDLTCNRTVAPTATITAYEAAGYLDISTYATTTTTPPTLATLKAQSTGLVLMGAANPRTDRCRFNDCMIGMYGRYTTGWDGDAPFMAHATAGTVNDIRVGIYLDGRGTAPAGTSMNGSFKIKTPTVVRDQFVGKAYGIIRDGRQSTAATAGDIRDYFPSRPETSGMDYGEFFKSAGSLDENGWSINPTHDTCRVNAIWGAGLGPGGCFRVSEPRISMVAGASQFAYAQGPCHGAYELTDGSFDGATAFSTLTGFATNGAVTGFAASGSVTNVNFGYVLTSGAEACRMGPFTYNSFPAQGASYFGVLNSGALNNDLEVIINNGAITNQVLLISAGAANNAYRTPKQSSTGTSSALVLNSGGGTNNNLG